MRRLRAWLSRFARLFHRQRDYSEFEREVESHLGRTSTTTFAPA
jgi:hypothetical protein